jgi:hypothetical protein
MSRKTSRHILRQRLILKALQHEPVDGEVVPRKHDVHRTLVGRRNALHQARVRLVHARVQAAPPDRPSKRTGRP